MSNFIPRVYHQQLEELTGPTWADYDKTLKRVHQQLKDEDLLVHIIVLGYGNNPSRVESTVATLRMLSEQVSADNVRVWLAHQGEELPAQLSKFTSEHNIEMLLAPKEDEDELRQIPQAGKTENILRSLKTIADRQFLSPTKQFVIFLDDDYFMYDAANVHSLYLPWATNFYEKDGVRRNDLYVKGGGLRLKLNDSVIQAPWLRASGTPAKFIDLCSQSLKQVGGDVKALEQASAWIPTRDNLIKELGDSVISELEQALDVTTQLGGRSSRGLSCYLQAHRDKPIARFLSEFSFLMHGDQGTTLENWMNANLAPGFGLELSFLMSTIQPEQKSVVNAIGLPHSHHPKSESENFAFGVDMFALMTHLVDSDISLQESSYSKKTWSYFSPTKLGFKKVTMNEPKDIKFYPSLKQMIRSNK